MLWKIISIFYCDRSRERRQLPDTTMDEPPLDERNGRIILDLNRPSYELLHLHDYLPLPLPFLTQVDASTAQTERFRISFILYALGKR